MKIPPVHGQTMKYLLNQCKVTQITASLFTDIDKYVRMFEIRAQC
jgi:hypothetical protein